MTESIRPDSGRERLARVALSRLAEPGDAQLGRLVEDLGAPAVLAAIRVGRLDAGPRSADYAVRLRGLDEARDLRQAERLGIRLVCPGESEWPTQLDQLGPARPLLLWVRGTEDLRMSALRSLAVVGARASTAYGEHVTGAIAGDLADRGWTVVSGAAYGIDGMAHRAALAAGAPTIAVLACGVDVPYPRGHESLLARIAAAGVVISELAPGCAPTKVRFLNRNRVIAALTRGTVVVEAAVRSGALNTAGHARGLNRPVMAVPGPVTTATSAGCHELVRVQGASLVTDANDVLDLVGSLGADEAPLRRAGATATDGLDPATMRVLEALPVQRPRGPAKLAQTAGVDLATVRACLGTLAALGLAESVDGEWRLARPARSGGGPPARK